MKRDDPEEWRIVPGYPDYEVSSYGAVRSWRIRRGLGRRNVPRYFRASFKASGYLQAEIVGEDGNPRNWLVHRLVALAFIGPSDLNALHKNGNKIDNRPCNLYYGTQADNSEDARRHGTLLMGEKHPRAKLSLENVQWIRSRVQSGATKASLARKFGVHEKTIYDIIFEKNWRHFK